MNKKWLLNGEGIESYYYVFNMGQYTSFAKAVLSKNYT